MKIIESTAIVLDIDNIDTDQIIPAKFLKSTERIGFGKHLFDSWRYEKNGSDNPQFPLNTAVKGSEILIAGNNFGCGSSREHAAWALADFGVKVVISSQFADIFKGNALNNGILPVEVSENCLRILKKYFSKNKNVSMKVDLAQQEVRVERDDISVYVAFDVDPLKKKFLMEGTNELDYLIEQREKIAAFEEQYIG